MRLRWTAPAADDLAGIKDYLQRFHPQFAEPTVRTIYRRIRSLKASPYGGRPGHRNGTRELPLTPLPYVVVYSVKRKSSRSCTFITVRKTGDDADQL
jgi:plasmid stabilization system protein ParE